MTMAAMKPFSRTPEKGAETLIWLADSDDITEHNELYYVDKEVNIPAASAQDMKMARRLWEVSDEQINSLEAN